MLQPVGRLPPSVYWRRRLTLAALPVVLIVITAWALFSGGGGKNGAGAAPPGSARGTATSTTRPSVGTHKSPGAGASTRTGTPTHSAKPGGASTSGAPLCRAADLRIQAQTGAKAYPVNSMPTLLLQVTNLGAHPCRQDLADKQIQMVITTGDVRVWGSHDCAVEPGVDVVKLMPARPVKRSLQWSGQTSVPGCTGTRLVAQAGTYKLTTILAGQPSTPVAFRLTSPH